MFSSDFNCQIYGKAVNVYFTCSLSRNYFKDLNCHHLEKNSSPALFFPTFSPATAELITLVLPRAKFNFCVELNLLNFQIKAVILKFILPTFLVHLTVRGVTGCSWSQSYQLYRANTDHFDQRSAKTNSLNAITSKLFNFSHRLLKSSEK